MSEKRRIFLTFPYEKIEKPITYHLIKDFGLIVNIFKARVTPEETGKLGIEIEGEKENIEKALEFLEKEGIKTNGFEIEIVFDKEKCVDCGVCVSVCPTKAISVNEKFEIKFNEDKCIACEACVDACPFKAITSND